MGLCKLTLQYFLLCRNVDVYANWKNKSVKEELTASNVDVNAGKSINCKFTAKNDFGCRVSYGLTSLNRRSLQTVQGLYCLVEFGQVTLPLCMRQRASWTYPPQVFTSVHLFSKIVRSGFTINSPLFQINWVKIHHRENKVGWRFTKLICFF